MAAFGSDEFTINPARNTHALLHFVEVFAPGSGNLSGILRIDNQNTTSRAGSPTAKAQKTVRLRNGPSLNCTAWGEVHDGRILRGGPSDRRAKLREERLLHSRTA